jgi:hypothetical protein
MRHEREIKSITPQELAGLGAGQIAYLRQLSGQEINDAFPGKVSIDPHARLWALFAADGSPIVLAGDSGAALLSAFEQQLVPVAIH